MMSEKTSNTTRKTVRVNLEVSPEVREQIKLLRVKSDSSSLAEVFRRSLALYEMILDHTDEGGKVVLESKDGGRDVIRLL